MCGQHCLNNLLQGPYFSADMLADIAQEVRCAAVRVFNSRPHVSAMAQLDQIERAHMLEAGTDTAQALRYHSFSLVLHFVNPESIIP